MDLSVRGDDVAQQGLRPFRVDGEIIVNEENGDLTAVQIPESESFKSAVCLEDIDIGDGRLYQNRAFCAAVTRRFC